MAKYLVGIFIDFMAAFWGDSLNLGNFFGCNFWPSFLFCMNAGCLWMPLIYLLVRVWFTGWIFANVSSICCFTSANELYLLVFLMDMALTVCKRVLVNPLRLSVIPKASIHAGDFLVLQSLGCFAFYFPILPQGASTLYLHKNYEGTPQLLVAYMHTWSLWIFCLLIGLKT